MNSGKFVGLELRRLGNLVRRKAVSKNGNDFENITPMHGWIISYLMEHEENEVFQRDLEEEFSMRRSTVSRALQLMEKNGMIERNEVEHDARLKRIKLKQLAYKAHEARTKEMETIEEELVKGISEEELAVFYKVVAKMKHNLE